jgi:hypothetical protein
MLLCYYMLPLGNLERDKRFSRGTIHRLQHASICKSKRCACHCTPRSHTMSCIDKKELDEIYAFAVDLGRKAGQLLLEGVEKRISGTGQGTESEKDSSVDIVTQTDEG